MKITKKQADMLAFFRENPDATYREASEALGRFQSSIIFSMSKLERNGVKTWKNKEKSPANWHAETVSRRLDSYLAYYQTDPECTVHDLVSVFGVDPRTAKKYMEIIKGEK